MLSEETYRSVRHEATHASMSLALCYDVESISRTKHNGGTTITTGKIRPFDCQVILLAPIVLDPSVIDRCADDIAQAKSFGDIGPAIDKAREILIHPGVVETRLRIERALEHELFLDAAKIRTLR